MPYGEKIILKPEDVCWVRRPHPIDPYLSLTPLEAAGVAIEIENLAKIYNRNYLLNDGRPGGLLVVRGEIDEDDKEELRNRFRGNLARAGHTTVIAGTDTAACMEKYFPDVKTMSITADVSNVKITYPQDLAIAEHVLARRGYKD